MRRITPDTIKSTPLDRDWHGEAMQQLQPQAVQDARLELNPPPVPPATADEAKTVHELCFGAIAKGHLLQPCKDRQEAERLCAWLKRELPLDLDAWIMVQTLDGRPRICVNIYTCVGL